jgi:hypothetical protein
VSTADPAHHRRLSPRALLALAVLALACGPVLWIAFGGRGGAAASAAAAAPAGVAAPRAPAATTADPAGCRRQALAHGLSDDPRAAQAYQTEALLGAHPPLPARGFHAPADTPAPAALVHALAHRFTVVKYRPTPDLSRWRALAASLRGRNVLVVSGGASMPFAVGAIAWGAQLTCADPTVGARAAAAAFAHQRTSRRR